MKRTVSLFSLCILASLCSLPAFAKVKDKVDTVKLDFGGKQRSYLLQIPSAAPANQPLPVVLLFHYQTGWNSDIMGAWKGYASHQGFIVVAPEAVSNDMWNSVIDGPDFLHAVLLDVAKKHPIDPTKVFIFGDDSGGIYGYQIALLDSQNWGAACAEHAILDTSSYSLFPHAQRKVAFQDWVGGEDPDHPLRVMVLEHDAFKNAGFEFDLKIIPNSPGTYGNVVDEVNEGCYNFFMKHPLPGPGAQYLVNAAAAAPAAAPAATPAPQ